METMYQQPTKKRPLGKYLGVLLILLIGVFVGRYIIPVSGVTAPSFELRVSEDGQRQFVFPTFWEAWDTVHNRYIGTVDDEKLFYGAVAGMINAVGDPYTVFSDPDATRQFQQTLDGQFSGVGIEIGVRGGLVRVIAPLEGSPAQQAGIQAGDIIVAVDGEQITSDTTLDDVVQSIRGPRGEEVVLTVAREGEGETTTEEIPIIRDTIVVESVIFETLPGNVAHVRITNFNGDTTEQFTNVVRQLATNKPAGIVLDVRNNPGGYLQTAVDIAGNFLDSGTLVVTEQGEKETVHESRGNPALKGIPVVVLVNQGSASASEILAGALQDQLGVKIVGQKTFGKGSVQELIPLKDGSSIRVTVAKWFTPSGRSISDEGIEPTVAVEQDGETDEDEQLQAAIEELSP